MKELKRYMTYSRKEVHNIFFPEEPYTNGGYWQSSQVKIDKTNKDYIFFVTYGSKQKDYEFNEFIDADGILHWQSQPGQSLKNERIQDFISHDYKKNNIYLFLRTNKKSKYTYLGLLKYISYDPSTEKPVHFKWKILGYEVEKIKLHSERIETYDLNKMNLKYL